MARPTPVRADQQGAEDDRHQALDSRDMNVRQLAQTVRYGRKITFLIFDADPITGYLSGMDQTYFYVLKPTHDGFERWMILRNGNPAFQMHENSTYDEEPQKESMEQVIAPFRSAMTNRVLRRNGTEPSARKAG